MEEEEENIPYFIESFLFAIRRKREDEEAK
jgi:hypothetical protein